MGVWQFIQDQVFGMKWLNELIGKGLSKLGLDVRERIGGSIQFFFYKGAQLGTILSFMMAVTTLSLPSLIMLRKAVKPKLLALFIGICTIGIILVGYLFNAFQFLLI